MSRGSVQAVFVVFLIAISARGTTDPVAWWDFEKGQDRVGHRRSPAGKDLIVWIKMESSKPVEVSLFPSSV